MRLPKLLLTALPLLLLTPTLHADVITYDVTGFIDTSDFLTISGPTVFWHHADTGGAAVGRHGGNNFPTVISSTLNGIPQMINVDWTPDWPSPPPAEIRYNTISSTYDQLTPALHASADVTVQATVLSGRGTVAIIRPPTTIDSYTLIVEFKDGFNGSANLDALITITTTPEPTSLTLLAIAAPLLLLRRK
jgi:hypothetical protein